MFYRIASYFHRMTVEPNRFITCGMYAFTDAQRAAWRQLFDYFFELSGSGDGQLALRFEHDPATLREPGLWFGHTCGYPLVTQLQGEFLPFCVPLFDVDGTQGRLYSSQIIVNAESAIRTLEQCRGRVAAINNADSNSGMNVFRHAIAGIHADGPFFSEVILSGSHLDSLASVARGEADVAAIDCVSYRLIADWQPDLVEQVRVLDNTISTCGLPLVVARDNEADTGSIIRHLNEALAQCSPEVEETLHLAGFEPVNLDDYQGIVATEQFAVDLGYPELV